MKVLDNGRIEVAAMCLGRAQSALDAAIAWCQERRISGQLLGEYQGIPINDAARMRADSWSASLSS